MMTENKNVLDEDKALDRGNTAEHENRLAAELKNLTEPDSRKLNFYKDFDSTVPDAGDVKGSAERALVSVRKRRTRRNLWISSGSVAAAVAIVVLVTSGILPNDFSKTKKAEDASMVASSEMDVVNSELPAPQSDYDSIYAAIESSNIGLEDQIESAKSEYPFLAGASQIDHATQGAPMAGDRKDKQDSANETAAPPTAMPGAPVVNASDFAGTAGAGGEPVYSDTNIQTEGVQEADVLKTDGKYIYTANSDHICIIEANDGHPKVLSKIPQPSDEGQTYFEMYINEDTLTLIRQGYNLAKTKDGKKKEKGAHGEIVYEGDKYMIDTSIDIYDVKDRKSPKKIGSLSQSGSYSDSRMIGNQLYLISTYDEIDFKVVDKKNPRTYVPMFAENGNQTLAAPKEISIPEKMDWLSYTVISGVDISSAQFTSHESMLGRSYATYASRDNLYLISSEWVNNASTDFIGPYHIRTDHNLSQIMRLSLKNGEVKVEAAADIPGEVNDQFSLDEYNGALRVVTTKNSYTDIELKSNREEDSALEGADTKYAEKYYVSEEGETDNRNVTSENYQKYKNQIEAKYGKIDWGEHREYGSNSIRTNGLYVLDMNLRTVGKVENLAPDEEVYSCRYMGDVAYFVTFRNTDPLFSVDLRDPQNPKVMGKLKIPGFSEYLHPYSSGLLFGLGKDANEISGNVTSLKVSMFDYSNPYDVREKDKLILKDLNYSEASSNHKAILVDARKSVIAFPADGKYVIIKYDGAGGFKRVMDVKLEPSISLRYDYEWEEWYQGLRGIFIDDVFYVIAPDVVKTYDMNDGFKKIDGVTIDEGAKHVSPWTYTELPGYTPDDVLYGID